MIPLSFFSPTKGISLANNFLGIYFQNMLL